MALFKAKRCHRSYISKNRNSCASLSRGPRSRVASMHSISSQRIASSLTIRMVLWSQSDVAQPRKNRQLIVSSDNLHLKGNKKFRSIVIHGERKNRLIAHSCKPTTIPSSMMSIMKNRSSAQRILKILTTRLTDLHKVPCSSLTPGVQQHKIFLASVILNKTARLTSKISTTCNRNLIDLTCRLIHSRMVNWKLRVKTAKIQDS